MEHAAVDVSEVSLDVAVGSVVTVNQLTLTVAIQTFNHRFSVN